MVSSLGGAERSLTPCGDRDYIHLAWSPDGRWLARARRDSRSQLSLELISPETLEHGGEYPDTMPQAIRLTDAEGRSCIYVPITQDGKVVDSEGYSFGPEDEW